MTHSRWVIAAAVCLAPEALHGQWWAAGDLLNEHLGKQTHGALTVSLEVRNRLEDRKGQSFGADPDRSANFVRTRLGLSWQPVSWLKIAGKLQDSRAPLYGAGAPANTRDPVDLHEAYVEIRPDSGRGLGLSVGRKMLTYGDARLIGIPDWGNTARTFDQARVWWSAGTARIEALMVSAPKVRPGDFNRPGLGDRVWGTYDLLPEIRGGHKAEVYLLRHDQDKAGGFTGDGTLGITSAGSRWTGPLGGGWKYTLEGIVQHGHVGAASHRAGAWSSVLLKPIGNVDLSGEYKFASGTANPEDPGKSGTFDQMYAANHDKFGHQDLFGWRNLHNVRAVAVWKVRPKLTMHAMYDSYWLAEERDGLYNGAGRLIARSLNGTAGRHIGQDVDLFSVWRPVKPLQLGAGVGVFANGAFIQEATPGVAPVYFYVFQSYSF